MPSAQPGPLSSAPSMKPGRSMCFFRPDWSLRPGSSPAACGWCVVLISEAEPAALGLSWGVEVPRPWTWGPVFQACAHHGNPQRKKGEGSRRGCAVWCGFQLTVSRDLLSPTILIIYCKQLRRPFKGELLWDQVTPQLTLHSLIPFTLWSNIWHIQRSMPNERFIHVDYGE